MVELNFDVHMLTSKRFIWELTKEGDASVLQLVSLAGLHSTALPSGLVCLSLSLVPILNSINDFRAWAELAQWFKSDGMLVYVETVQRKEKEIGCDAHTR
jgi:isocitrate lyase